MYLLTEPRMLAELRRLIELWMKTTNGRAGRGPLKKSVVAAAHPIGAGGIARNQLVSRTGDQGSLRMQPAGRHLVKCDGKNSTAWWILVGCLLIGVAGSSAYGADDVAVSPERLASPASAAASQPPRASVAGEGGIGPDVIIGKLHEVGSFGALGGISAFSVGTISCNAGDEPLNWFFNTNQHPVIAQNMYRLHEGRFEQIGMSWVKHGFSALTGNECGFGCILPPMPGAQLGVGCSDPYSANLNGSQIHLGPRSDVNGYTGFFNYPFSAAPVDPVIGRRLQVLGGDLEPSLNPGADYFVEALYITPDDAAAGNQNNNAAYRRVSVIGASGNFTLELEDFTHDEDPAIRAWKVADPSVIITGSFAPGDGRFWAASKATALGNGMWHYEFALQNLTSHRSARSFNVTLPAGVTASNLGFHDVMYHSGEPFASTDWESSVGGGSVSWTTEAFNTNPNANALRWGTLYNFRFDADRPPVTGTTRIGLFRPGSPSDIFVQTFVPEAPETVCGDNMIGDGEDCDPPDQVHCDDMCQWICGDGEVQTGEECDPPDGLTCDDQCQTLFICGNGVTDPDEDCDPPNGVTCDENCQRIPICGDGIVDPDEECDPPNMVTCDEGCVRISNDNCLSAVDICPGVFDGTINGSSNDGAATCDNFVSRDVWFKYVPVWDGELVLSTCGGDLDTILSVHTECSADPAAELACSDNACLFQSFLTIPVVGGTPYLIRVAEGGEASGDFRIDVDGPPCLAGPAINDECDFLLPVEEGTTLFTTLRGTTDGPPEPDTCSATGTSQLDIDAWFCYTPSCSGTVEVSVCDADFDALVAAYAGCQCPTESSASSCGAETCVSGSEVTFAAQAGEPFLIRVGGRNGANGIGTLSITCNGTGEALRGGQLWDKWWAVNGTAPPQDTHPLYPQQGQQSGSTTHRCKECHGWDYKGVDGAYGSGGHFTGILGVHGSTLTADAMFDLIRGGAVPFGHGFENNGLSHQDIWDLVEFLQTLTIDTSAYIDGNGAFIGSAVTGEIHYTQNGSIACIFCHGADGTAINFGPPGELEWVGTIAHYNPWEFLHKVRFAQPASPMPSWLAGGGDDQGAADIGAYAQLTFPIDCFEQSHCDDGLFCTAPETCTNGFCIAATEPCPGETCDEELNGCVSGLCPTPSATAVGSRYFQITPAPGGDPVALWVAGISGNTATECVIGYVQEDGSLGPNPVFRLPEEWGVASTTDFGIRSDTTYAMRADCGIPGDPDMSFASTATTWQYADVDHNGVHNFADIQAEVLAFQGNFGPHAMDALDIAPCSPNHLINLDDAFSAVRAFQGLGIPCVDPCP